MKLQKYLIPTLSDYTKQSDSRKFPYKDLYISKPLVKNNWKLKGIRIFDLLAGSFHPTNILSEIADKCFGTCINDKTCKGDCYAKKAQYMYFPTWNKRFIQTVMAMLDPEYLQELIVLQLSRSKNNLPVRIHSSGEFFSQYYVDLWTNIVKRFPQISFYTYTKMDQILNFSELEECSNINIIRSLVNGKRNFGDLKYCSMLKEKYGYFICPATVSKLDGSIVKCGIHCNRCFTDKNVCFLQH